MCEHSSVGRASTSQAECRGFESRCSLLQDSPATCRVEHEVLMRAGKYSFAHRKDKKTDFRQLWIVRLNAAVRESGFKSYSTFIAKLKKNGFILDRKVLAEFASDRPEIFARISKQVV